MATSRFCNKANERKGKYNIKNLISVVLVRIFWTVKYVATLPKHAKKYLHKQKSDTPKTKLTDI